MKAKEDVALGLGMPYLIKDRLRRSVPFFAWFITAQIGPLALQVSEPLSRACGSKTLPREHRVSESSG